jgi:hypothetical protein
MNFNDLLETEERLRDHFRRLAASKKLAGGDIPSFALEHPLNEIERRKLGKALSDRLRNDRVLSPRFCASWVVHATEQGYEFEGLQYWTTFANQTPNWEQYGDRNTLKKLFKQFASEFSGVKPKGVWATHYPYISWPVTNAIVPKDLQLRLAQSIYQARNRLTYFVGRSHESLGSLIREHSYYASTRYAHFLEQTELVGQIVHALIQQDNDHALIRSSSLTRIVEDLSTRTQAREWLSDARSSYKRAKVRLLAHGKVGSEDTVSDEISGQDKKQPPRLQSFQFTIHRTNDDQLKVWLTPPSFQAMCGEHLGLRAVLETSRLTVDCHGDRSSPARSLLSSTPREWSLCRWPADGERIIAFTPPLPALESILTGDLTFPAATVWIFLIHDDGYATLCREPVVHADASFLIAARDHTAIAHLGTSVTIQCDGIAVVRVVIPKMISLELIAQLKAAGIGTRRHISIVPAGLYPRRWSEDGESEWLTSESIMLAVEHQPDIAILGLAINNDVEQLITLPDTETALVSLGHLAAGDHTLRLNAYSRSDLGDATHEAHATLHLLVRAPSPWVPSRITTEELVVTSSPVHPSVDDLLSGRLIVSAEGMPGMHVRCRLILTNGNGDKGIDHELFKLPLPFAETTWSQHLESFLNEHANDREFLAMTEGCLEFESVHFGIHRISLAARQQPLRWALERARNGGVLTLTNDGVGEDVVALAHYPFINPLRELPVNFRSALSGIDVAKERGLFVARLSTSCQAVAIGPPQPEGLSTLVEPLDSTCWDDHTDVATIIEQYNLWNLARASNGLSRLRQMQVLRSIRRHVHRLIFGAQWISSEEQLPDSPNENDWDRLERAVDPYGPISYAISLSRGWSSQRNSNESPEQLHRRISLAYKLSLEHSADIATAWHLANDLAKLPSGPSIDIESTKFKKFATLARGARLLYLSADRHRGEAND